jgi:beta-xylosidase
MADPTIFYDKGTYYLYGTGGDAGKGFLVYTSSDLKSWKGPAGTSDGYALKKGDAYGTKGFWAPQVFRYKNKFYMAYTADENIAIAVSDSPLGPFKQQTIKAISGPGKQIDPYVFMDGDGKKYLYHVRLGGGNKLFVARLKDDLSDIEPGTAQECLHGTEPWENTTASPHPITEGPTVLKHRGVYYLFYSANDFRNINYAVGYATSRTPLGPWEKYSKNPIINRQNMLRNGTGHGDFLEQKKGGFIYVFHTHRTDQVVSPRVTAIVHAAFLPAKKAQADVMEIDNKSLYFPLLSK